VPEFAIGRFMLPGIPTKLFAILLFIIFLYFVEFYGSSDDTDNFYRTGLENMLEVKFAKIIKKMIQTKFHAYNV
jgi:hypothetical protein